MGWFDSDKNEDERNHQDNFRGRDLGEGGWENGSYQYCKFCDQMRRFIWDRCEHCKNN